MMKIYHLIRTDDESGVSGTGHVAWACEFPHGAVAVTFRDDSVGGPGVRSYYWYDSLDDAEKIHGHGGRTRFVEVHPLVLSGKHETDGYEHGAMEALMDDMENVTCDPRQFPPVEAPERVKAENREHWMAGYLDDGRRKYGRDWLRRGEERRQRWRDAKESEAEPRS